MCKHVCVCVCVRVFVRVHIFTYIYVCPANKQITVQEVEVKKILCTAIVDGYLVFEMLSRIDRKCSVALFNDVHMYI